MSLFSRKPIADIVAQAESGKVKMKRVLGASDLILLGIGAIIGAGLFSITGIAAANHAGPAIIISFIIAAIGSSFAALCYSELAGMIPVSGSAYTYTYATMGEFFAWVIGWDLILEYAIGAATVSISWSAYFISLLNDFNIVLPSHLIASPWQPTHLQDGSEAFGFINLPAVLILMAITWLLVRGVKETSVVNKIIVVLKVIVVLLFIVLGYAYIHPENHHPFIPENKGVFGEFGLSGIMRGAGIVFFAYIGFDMVSTAAQEVKAPQKSIPIGIFGSLFLCTLLYILAAYVLTGLVNYKDLTTPAPFALAIDQTPYLWMKWLIKLAILAGLTSVILALLYGQSRIFYSMAKDGFLPAWLTAVHPKYQTPWHASVAIMIFVSLFAAFAPLSLVGEMTSIGTLFAFILVSFGVMILRVLHPEYKRPFKVPLNPVLPILGILSSLSMMIFLSVGTWIRLVVWLLIGLGIYFGYSRKKMRFR